MNQTNADGSTPPPNQNQENNLNSTLSFVNDLNDIIAGKYDNDSDKVLELLENAINEAEEAGEMDKYMKILDAASNHLTALLMKEAESVN